MKISNRTVIGDQFFYDGCHKIYIIEDEDDKKLMFKHGWEPEDIHPISELLDVYNDTCPLVFISNCKLNKEYVKQQQKSFIVTLDNGERFRVKNEPWYSLHKEDY